METVTGPIGVPPIITRNMRIPGKTMAMCRWYLKCRNPHTTTIPHASLGRVPACQSCYDKVEALQRGDS